ncbi:MAG: AgmX/PglI C-terminal domain-containing protein [Myxococcota bacterium]|jgi:serine/threonine protein kinase|nr:AgmX/PglI C-terminal domain-containing protein [Myxococcota bacterium]
MSASEIQYDMLLRLAEGEVVEYWLARQSSAGRSRLVVVKRVICEHLLDANLSSVLKASARRAMKLDLQDTVRVLDIEEQGDLLVVTDIVHGEHLADFVSRIGELGYPTVQPAIAFGLMAQVATVLDAAHRQVAGLVHANLSPRAVLLTYEGRLRVANFDGVSVDLPAAASGSLLGNPRYMSPEQCMGKPVDARTDVFAVGIVLWEMLCGRPAFQSTESFELLDEICDPRPLPTPGQFNKQLPPLLCAAVNKAVAKNPDERFPDCGQLAAALEKTVQRLNKDVSPNALVGLMSKLFAKRQTLWRALSRAEAAGQEEEIIRYANQLFGGTVENGPITEALSDDEQTVQFRASSIAQEATWGPPTEREVPVVSASERASQLPAFIEQPVNLSDEPEPDTVRIDQVLQAKLAATRARSGERAMGFREPVLASPPTPAPPPVVEQHASSPFDPAKEFSFEDEDATGEFALSLAPELMAGGNTDTQQVAQPPTSMLPPLAQVKAKAFTPASAKSEAVAEPVGQAAADDLLGPASPKQELISTVRSVSLDEVLQGASSSPNAELEQKPAPKPAAEPTPSPTRSAPRLRIVEDDEDEEDSEDADERGERFPVSVLLAPPPPIPEVKRRPPVLELFWARAGVVMGSRVVSAQPFEVGAAFGASWRNGKGVIDLKAGQSARVQRADGSESTMEGPAQLLLDVGERCLLSVGELDYQLWVHQPAVRKTFNLVPAAIAMVALIYGSAAVASILLHVSFLYGVEFLGSQINLTVENEPPPEIFAEGTMKREEVKKKAEPKKLPKKEPPKPKKKVVQKTPKVDPAEQKVVIPNAAREQLNKKMAARRPAGARNQPAKTEDVVSALRSPVAGDGKTLKDVVTNIDAPATGGNAAFKMGGTLAAMDGSSSVNIGTGGGGDLGALGGEAAKAKDVGKLTDRDKGDEKGKVRGKVSGMKGMAKVEGSLDQSAVQAVINENLGKIQRCYETALIGNTSLSGKITFDWTVGSSGKVTEAREVSSTLGDPKVSACIIGVIKKMKFPKPTGGDVTIRYPFMFKSG